MSTVHVAPGRLARAAVLRAALVLVGTYVGLLGAVVHRLRADAGVIVLPWGLVLALVTTALVAWSAGRLVPVGAAWVAVGWTLVLVLQGLGGAGSYLVGSDAWGWAFLGGGLVVLTVVILLGPRRGARPPRLGR